MNWKDFLLDGVLDWLLEPENPSIRYWTLQHLSEKSPKDIEVRKAQSDIMESRCVEKILRAQEKEGHWEQKENMYLPKYTATTHNLLLLAELGAIRTNQIEQAIEHVFQFQVNSGHFRMTIPKTKKGKDSKLRDMCCFDGNILYYLLHFGYLKDPRVKQLIQFLIENHSDDYGWLCRAFPLEPTKVFPKNCFMGAVKVLRGLVVIPIKDRPKEVQLIINQEVENIFQNEIYKYLRLPDGSRKIKAGWRTFRFPLFYQSDILEVLDILTSFGVKDERMQETIDMVASKQMKDGKWEMRSTFNEKMLCDIDVKNEASKWITLRALRVLKRYYN